MNIMKELELIRKNLKHMTFGEVIRQTRHTLGMKQYKMADILGISTAMLKVFECNNYKSPVATGVVEKLASAFEYDKKILHDVMMKRVIDHMYHMSKKS